MRLVVVRGPDSAGPFELVPGPNLVGRDPGCAVQLVSRRVSRKHAVAFLTDNKLKVSDLGSANGLFDEAGHRVETVTLSNGRRVQVGDFVLRFELEEESSIGDYLELDESDPLTDEDDLVLEDEEEVTPVRHGPMPKLRVAAGGGPEPAGEASPRSAPVLRPRPVGAGGRPLFHAPRAAAPPQLAPASVPPVAPPSSPPKGVRVPDPGRLTIDPSLDLPAPDVPSAETSVRMARPVLPFGPPSGGFASFGQPQRDAGREGAGRDGAGRDGNGPPTVTSLSPQPPPSLSPPPSRMVEPDPPPPMVQRSSGPPLTTPSPFSSPSTSSEPPPPRSAPRAPAPPPPFVATLQDEPTPRANPLVVPAPEPSRSDLTPVMPISPGGAPPPTGFGPPRPVPMAAARAAATAPLTLDPPTVSDAGPRPRHRAGGGGAWYLQAFGVLAFAASVLVCGPFGGLFSQVTSAADAAEALSLARGDALAESLGNRNAVALAEGRGIALETASALGEAGVQEAMLTDAAGTVLAPPERLRTTIARTPGFVAASAEHDTVHVVSDNGAWEIVAPVRGEVATGSSARTIVGWVWLRYDPSVIAHEAVSPWLRAIAGIFWLGVAGMIVAAGGWWLVVRPLRALREETELAVTGSVDEVEPIVKFGPLEDLAHSINRAVRRARR